MQRDERYYFFWSGFLSQWKKCVFELEGRSFSTAEQYMMFKKAMLFGDGEIADQICATNNAKKQKSLGRKVAGFDDAVWNKSKWDIVLAANLAKFGQNEGLRRKLFQTHPRQIVEASPLDAIWGIGMDAESASQTPQADWPGENLLGLILDDVRKVLAEAHPEQFENCRDAGLEGLD